MRMKKYLILIILILALIPTGADVQTSCGDYCYSGVYYSGGAYSARTGTCSYSSRTTCSYGCNVEATACASAPATRQTTPTPTPTPTREATPIPTPLPATRSTPTPTPLPTREPTPVPATRPTSTPAVLPEPTPSSIFNIQITPTPQIIPPVQNADSDKDGIYDIYDVCPDTEAGLQVGNNGCPACKIDTDGDDPYKDGSVGYFKWGNPVFKPYAPKYDGKPQFPDGVWITLLSYQLPLEDKCLADGKTLQEYYCEVGQNSCIDVANDGDFKGYSATGALSSWDFFELSGYACVLHPAVSMSGGEVKVKNYQCQNGCGDGACFKDTDNDTVVDPSDNCPVKANADQKDSDKDGKGDICDDDNDNDGCLDKVDKFPFKPSGDADNDGIADDCDSCPFDSKNDEDKDGVCGNLDNCKKVKNADQADVDNDGVGDACDCTDALQGSNETGIDCGGSCGACIKCDWCGNKVTPIRIKNADYNSKTIDVVFVPHNSFKNNPGDFLPVAISYIRDGYLKFHDLAVDPIPADYANQFNFYYYNDGYGTVDDKCDWELPEDFDEDVSFYDSAGILRDSDDGVGLGTGCSFLSPPSSFHARDKLSAVLHESSHSIFGLRDEYCGAKYKQADNAPNVWSSEDNCEDDANSEGWNSGNCRQIANAAGTCQEDFWRYDPDNPNPDMMIVCGGSWGFNCDSPYRFQEADTRRIKWTFDNWSTLDTKGILIRLNIKEGKMTRLGVKVTPAHPDIGLQEGSFKVDLMAADGKLIKSFELWDPRIRLGDEVVYLDDVNFPVRFPWYKNLRAVNIYEKASGKLMISVDLGEAIADFCKNNSNDPECRPGAGNEPQTTVAPPTVNGTIVPSGGMVTGSVSFGSGGGESKKLNIAFSEGAGKTEVEAGGVKVFTKESLKIEEAKMFLGQNEVAVAPDLAVGRVVEKEKLVVDSSELKTVNNKPVYRVNGSVKAKILKIFSVSMKVTADVDAETGDLKKISRPWWSFLAF